MAAGQSDVDWMSPPQAMGEFGTRENGHWARAFAAAGIPVKSCVLHSLSLTYGF